MKRNLTGLDPAGRGGGGGGLDNAGFRRFFFRILVSTFTLSCFFNRKIKYTIHVIQPEDVRGRLLVSVSFRERDTLTCGRILC